MNHINITFGMFMTGLTIAFAITAAAAITIALIAFDKRAGPRIGRREDS